MESIETHGVKTHFWLENTYKDKSGREHFQDNELINFRLWQITKWGNLIQVQTEFPEIQWEYLLQQLWTVTSVKPVLTYLCCTPKRTASLSLAPLQGVLKEGK